MFKSVSVMTGIGMEKEYINQRGLKSSKNVVEWMTVIGGEGVWRSDRG